MTIKEFVYITRLSPLDLKTIVEKESWAKVLEFRVRYARTLNEWSKTNKGKDAGLDAIQLSALKTLGMLDKWLWRNYVKHRLPKFLRENPQYINLSKGKAKGKILLEYKRLTQRHF